MLLNNIINFFSYNLYKGAISTSNTLDNGNMIGVNYAFSSVFSPSSYHNTGNTMTSTKYNIASNVGIVIGKDTTPPQKTDYQMVEPITTGFTTVNSLLKKGDILGVVSSITNTSEENITVNSVGLWGCPAASSSILSTYLIYLLTKTLLEQPLIIKPSETKTITITINFNKMLDSVNNA